MGGGVGSYYGCSSCGAFAKAADLEGVVAGEPRYREVWPGERPSLVIPEPAPKRGTGDVWAEIIAEARPGPVRDLYVARREQGIAKYGTPLQRDNGRDHVTDAIQEALDGLAYARAARTEDGHWTHEGIQLIEMAEYLFVDALTLLLEARPHTRPAHPDPGSLPEQPEVTDP
jgi:hypothetical protein